MQLENLLRPLQACFEFCRHASTFAGTLRPLQTRFEFCSCKISFDLCRYASSFAGTLRPLQARFTLRVLQARFDLCSCKIFYEFCSCKFCFEFCSCINEQQFVAAKLSLSLRNCLLCLQLQQQSKDFSVKSICSYKRALFSNNDLQLQLWSCGSYCQS